jgi:hypothetical protein
MTTLKLASAISPNVAIRSRLRSVLDAENPSAIDFSGVVFLSRSCADEYVKWKRDKNIVEKNVTSVVQNMIEAVHANRPRPGANTRFTLEAI